MFDEIIHLEEASGLNAKRAIKLNQEDFWHSDKKQKSLEKFQKSVEKDGGLLNMSRKLAYADVTKINMNEDRESVKVHFNNEKGKDTKMVLTFKKAEQALAIGNFIGEKTNLQKTLKPEKATIKLLKNLGITAIIAAVTIAIGMADPDSLDENASEGHSRSARRGRFANRIIRLLHESIGEVGIFAIGGLITLFFLYSAYKTYKNPVNDIIYE